MGTGTVPCCPVPAASPCTSAPSSSWSSAGGTDQEGGGEVTTGRLDDDGEAVALVEAASGRVGRREDDGETVGGLDGGREGRPGDALARGLRGGGEEVEPHVRTDGGEGDALAAAGAARPRRHVRPPDVD